MCIHICMCTHLYISLCAYRHRHIHWPATYVDISFYKDMSAQVYAHSSLHLQTHTICSRPMNIHMCVVVVCMDTHVCVYVHIHPYTSMSLTPSMPVSLYLFTRSENDIRYIYSIYIVNDKDYIYNYRMMFQQSLDIFLSSGLMLAKTKMWGFMFTDLASLSYVPDTMRLSLASCQGSTAFIL